MSHRVTVNVDNVRVNLGLDQIRQIVIQLDAKEVIKLIKEYQRKRRIKELDVLTSELAAQVKSSGVSEREIDQLVKEIRKADYEKTHSRN